MPFSIHKLGNTTSYNLKMLREYRALSTICPSYICFAYFFFVHVLLNHLLKILFEQLDTIFVQKTTKTVINLNHRVATMLASGLKCAWNLKAEENVRAWSLSKIVTVEKLATLVRVMTYPCKI